MLRRLVSGALARVGLVLLREGYLFEAACFENLSAWVARDPTREPIWQTYRATGK